MLEVKFPSGVREVSVFGLTQWDKGQKLSLSFDNMPENFQVHFSSRGSSDAVVVEAYAQAGMAVVDIPDELLINDSDVLAWIYLTGENSGETVGKATLYVKPRPRPKGYMEDLVPSQQQTVENIIKDIKANLDYVLSNGVDSEYVPEYVKEEAYETAKKVLACQNENTVSFLASADYHYDLQNADNCMAISHMASAMKLIRSMCKTDFGLCLGGYIADSSNKSKDDGIKEFLSVNKTLSEAMGELPVLRAVGADDLLSASYYRNGAYFDCDELYTLIGKWCSKAVFNPEDKTGGYCYMDVEDEKLRVICLNTSDFEKEDAVKPETDKAFMSAQQLMWFCTALDMSSKEDAEGWSTVIVSHYPVNYYSNFAVLRNIVKSYIAGAFVDLTDSTGTAISYDFSGGKNVAHIIAFFNGALHNFKVNILEGTSIPLISIPNACVGNENYYADEKYTAEETLLYGENATWQKTPGSGKDTAFSVVTIDKAEGRITLHCYGAGYDRVIDLGAIDEAPPASGGGDSEKPGGSDDGSGNGVQGGENEGGENGEGGNVVVPPVTDYENIISYAMNENGEVYNGGLGYMNGYALRGDGSVSTESNSDFTHTGYIYAEKGDYICIKGYNWTSDEGNCLVIFGTDYTHCYTVPINSETDILSDGISFEKGVMTFDTTKVTARAMPDEFFIRISTKASGENLIMTYNAPLA